MLMASPPVRQEPSPNAGGTSAVTQPRMATSTVPAAGCATEQTYTMPTGQDALSAGHAPATGDMGAGTAPTRPLCNSDRIAGYTSAVAGGPVALPAAPAAM